MGGGGGETTEITGGGPRRCLSIQYLCHLNLFRTSCLEEKVKLAPTPTIRQQEYGWDNMTYDGLLGSVVP